MKELLINNIIKNEVNIWSKKNEINIIKLLKNINKISVKLNYLKTCPSIYIFFKKSKCFLKYIYKNIYN